MKFRHFQLPDAVRAAVNSRIQPWHGVPFSPQIVVRPPIHGLFVVEVLTIGLYGKKLAHILHAQQSSISATVAAFPDRFTTIPEGHHLSTLRTFRTVDRAAIP
jgi:hypothetical protein